MTKEKLAKWKGGVSIIVILVYLIFCAFYFTYGKATVEGFVEELGEQQELGGLGPAIAYVCAIFLLAVFVVPSVLFLVAGIGNLVKKGEKLPTFTVVSLVAECIGAVVLFFFTACFMAATGYDVFSILVAAAFDLAVLASLAHSIYVLIVAKRATN